MFHERISAWNKITAKLGLHYISVCSLVGHGWKLAYNTIDYQWTCGCIFLQQLIDIMCASDTELEPESQNDDDTEQSTEVENFRCRICSKEKYSKENDILLVLPVK